MNPLVRHFLPSVIRGVYRFDDGFSEVEDEEEFKRFVTGKLQFFPGNVKEDICRAAKLSEDFHATQRQRVLPANLLDPNKVISERAKAFFRLHPYFKNALVDDRPATDAELKDAQNYLEIQFIKKVLAPLLNDKGLRAVHPQRSIGPYFVDFALEGTTKLALEVDGFGKFKSRNELDDFTKRQNYITAQGWRVIRFTYAQVMETTEVTLRVMHNLLKGDTELRHFVTVQWHTGFLRGLHPSEAGRSTIDLVNNFYGVQDWLIDSFFAEHSPAGVVRLKDGFGFEFPFVATAISTLYEFLDAIAGIVDVEFDLPPVDVSSALPPDDWAVKLHRLVSIKSTDIAEARVVDVPTIKGQSGGVPTPTCAVDSIKFRHNLSLDDIRQRLEYFTRTVFGYSSGTKPFQERILQRVFNGQNVLGISATGSGKSFCFWLPALVKPGLTLVIAPLRSLMRDQRLNLLNYGIAAAEFINSDVDYLNQRRILEEAKLGYVKLLYISPERLRIKKFLSELERLREFVPINFLAVDEAHCISEWGHDFRPSYLKLPFLQESLSEGNAGLQLIALTATAGQQVQQDMLGILKLSGAEDGDVVQEGVADRERFSYQIVSVKDGASKSKTYRDILMKHIPKALRQQSLPSLIASRNGRNEKSLGLVFCVYADPHGKHSIWDGTAHYLFETMRVLEPDKIIESRRAGIERFSLTAFSKDKVRAFSSKPPTLCPRCHSYAYTSKPRSKDDADDDEVVVDDEELSSTNIAGVKVCYHCKKEFNATDALTPANWQELVKDNQSDFKNSLFDILVTTKGFGMGIDKSSVRFVVHTSFSSGLESWYQEVGRAGRDNERAHVVLLTDPPNEPCRKELAGLEIKRPRCSYKGGCPHGKEGLCDYGKQHMFVTSSYPGAESDAVSALRMLDKLIVARATSKDGAIVVNSSNKYLSYDELAIYRLTVLGLVEDYVVTYTPNPQFDVEFTAPELPDRAEAVKRLERKMQGCLAEHLSHFSSRHGRTIGQELVRCCHDYRPLEEFTAKLRTFSAYSEFVKTGDTANLAFYQAIYNHLLLLLDHTYKDVVMMRYDMLWNLLTVVTSRRCRRLEILPHFHDLIEETYRCGACDNCTPNLEFPPIRNAPQARASSLEKELLLERTLATDSFDLKTLRQLSDDFADYPTAKYRQARSVLEGNANNLPALFLAREFSPREELEGNTKRLLRTANQRPVPLSEVHDIFNSSPRELKPDLLVALNEADTACDTLEGWKFLVEEAGEPEQRHNEEVLAMRECLEFFIAVEDVLSDHTHSLKTKAHELEESFHA